MIDLLAAISLASIFIVLTLEIVSGVAGSSRSNL